jgi:methylmalonyl-CoA mutase
LTVRPYDAGREEASVYGPVFSRRIARNVQHLLKLEAGFGSVADPAAGSYYVENLTRQMVMRAWEDFVERPN